MTMARVTIMFCNHFHQAWDIVPSQHDYLSPYMAQISPILQLWAQDYHFVVHLSSHGIHHILSGNLTVSWCGELKVAHLMTASTHDLVIWSIPHISAPYRKTIWPLIYTIAQLALAHSMQCNVLHLLKSRHYTPNSTIMMAVHGGLCTLLSTEEVLGIVGSVRAGLRLLVCTVCLTNQIVQCWWPSILIWSWATSSCL